MDSLEDFSRKYRCCYLRRRKDNEVVYFEDLARNNCLSLETANHGTIAVKYNEDFFENYDLDFPNTGFFQYKKWALLLLKSYAKQYSRGLSEATGDIYNPIGYFSREIKVPRLPSFGLSLADAIWNGREFTPNIMTAIKSLHGRKLFSIPMSDTFAISLSHASSGYIIWHLVSPIAECDGKNVITMIDAPFRQEMRDFLYRTQQEFEWKLR